MLNDIERLKVADRHYHAGALAALLGLDSTYGCHYGMRSERYLAVEQYQLGHAAASAALTNAAIGRSTDAWR